jgi:multidrug efflux pump
MLVNLKPQGGPRRHGLGVIRRLNDSLSGVVGITAYMQPVQDLTIDDRISKTQFQFVLQSANPDDLNVGSPS